MIERLERLLPASPRGRRVLVAGVVVIGLLWVLTGLAGRSDVFGGRDMFRAVQAGTLVKAPRADLPRPKEPLVLASRTAGLRVTALGELERVRTKDGWRRPYEGSRLVGFRIGDGSCEREPCRSWRTLSPRLVVDGEEQPLPGGASTFAVLAPPGVEQLDLVVEADGLTQSLSLLEDRPAPDGIVVLRRPERERHVTLDRRLVLTETTSIPLDGGAGPGGNQFVRELTLTAADLRFFLDDRTPARPQDAFLVLSADYAYRGRTDRHPLWPSDVAFVTADGRRYPGEDLDPAEDMTLVGFEVPGSVRGGYLQLGGSAERSSTTGTPYQAVLQAARVPVRFGR